MKNDFLTLIMTRRSIRAYKPDAVPADVLARVLEAGTYAPSAMGEQSATIVAVETKAYRDRLTKLNAAVIGKDVDPYYGAPVIVVVLGDGGKANYMADGSCVLENLMLAAHAEGLGSVWVNREREIFDSPDGKALLRDWGSAGDAARRRRDRARLRRRSRTGGGSAQGKLHRARLKRREKARPPAFRRAGCYAERKPLSRRG